MNVAKFKFYIINFSYFLITLIAAIIFFFILLRISINTHLKEDYLKSSLSPENYFHRNHGLVRMIIRDTYGSHPPKVFDKKTKFREIFTATFNTNKKSITLWYTSDFFLKFLVSFRNKIIVFVLLTLALISLGYYLLLKKILFLPLDAILKEKKDAHISGIFKYLKDFLNSKKQQLELAHTHASVLLQAARSISSHIELNQILSRILDLVVEKFPGTSCAITMLDDNDYLRIRASRGMTVTKSLKLKRGEGFIGECLESKKMIVIQDTDIDSKIETKHIDISENIKSFVHVPIIVENKAIGTFTVNSAEKNYFTPEVLITISTMCEYLSIAIVNAKLYERIKDFSKRLESEVSYTASELLRTNTKLVNKIRELKSISEIFSIPTTDGKVFNKIFNNITEIVSFDYAAFFRYDSVNNNLNREFQIFYYKSMESDLPLKIDCGEVDIFRSVILSGEPYIWDGMRDVKLNFIPKDIIYMKSVLVLPVFSSGIISGILLFVNKVGGEKFDQDDIDFLKLVALHIGMLVEKQELEAEVKKLKSKLKVQ